MNDILERLDALPQKSVEHVDSAAEIRRLRDVQEQLGTEVTRLRASLAVVADPKNWGRHQYQEATWRIWRGTGEFANPMVFVSKSMEASDGA